MGTNLHFLSQHASVCIKAGVQGNLHMQVHVCASSTERQHSQLQQGTAMVARLGCIGNEDVKLGEKLNAYRKPGPNKRGLQAVHTHWAWMGAAMSRT